MRRAVRRKRPAFPAGVRVSFRYPTADGLVTGDGRVLRLIDHAPCGATGFRQPIYLVSAGDALRVIPHEYLTRTEGGGG